MMMYFHSLPSLSCKEASKNCFYKHFFTKMHSVLCNYFTKLHNFLAANFTKLQIDIIMIHNLNKKRKSGG